MRKRYRQDWETAAWTVYLRDPAVLPIMLQSHETNAGIVCITAEEDTEVDVQGSIKNAEGDVQLVFEAQDKTRTVIVDGENREVEEKVAVAEGKSEIYFTGEGSCEFKLEMTAGDGVNFDDGMEKPEQDSGAEDAQDWKSVVGTD